VSEKDSEETEGIQLIFRLAYNMGVVWNYRNLLREFYSLTMSLRHDRNLSDSQLEDIIKTLDKTATALLDEDKKLTSEKLTEWKGKK
jgi:hypothetical protein